MITRNLGHKELSSVISVNGTADTIAAVATGRIIILAVSSDTNITIKKTNNSGDVVLNVGTNMYVDSPVSLPTNTAAYIGGTSPTATVWYTIDIDNM
jgi:uncharacterized protein with beta-barrel porin domain